MNHPTANNRLCDLTPLGLIQIRGKEHVHFLQGQLTNDVASLDGTKCQLTGCCDPKGHLLASGWLFPYHDGVLFQLPGETLPALLQRFSMLRFRSQVELADASETLARIGLVGQNAAAQLTEVLDGSPPALRHVTQQGDLCILQLPGVVPRFEIIGPESAVGAIRTRLAADATTEEADFWALQEIRAGIPSIYPATAGAFIPQMVNMQLLDGISFSKGCYCGQEVVARAQHRGSLRRRMYLANIGGTERPSPGDPLFSPSAEHGKAAGVLVDARPAPEGGFDALVMVQIPCFEADDIHLGGASGEKLHFRDLPYRFAET